MTSRDAKKVYSHGTAAVLRAKDCIMKTVTNVQENASDIYAEAKQINADREIEAEAQVVEDEAEAEEQATEMKFVIKHEIRGRIRFMLHRRTCRTGKPISFSIILTA